MLHDRDSRAVIEQEEYAASALGHQGANAGAIEYFTFGSNEQLRCIITTSMYRDILRVGRLHLRLARRSNACLQQIIS